MIFVQIAAYRDSELVPTILDCLKKAKHPNNLRFGICWQCETLDRDLAPFLCDRRFRIEKFNWQDSPGLCWARSRIQKLYQGEEHTLQIDSHHRFAKSWDEWLIATHSRLPCKKSILSSYAAPYDPKNDSLLEPVACKMVVDHFTPGGTILIRPHKIPNPSRLDSPIKARFVSGHFLFTIGQHCIDYRYDPNLYFAGDELSLSLRSYTLGYDLYHPHRNPVWHEYTRKHKVMHWNDHSENNPEIDLPWSDRDQTSKARLRALTGFERSQIDLGEFGLGSDRSLQDYERYAGIDFKRKRFHEATLRGEDPPSNGGEFVNANIQEIIQ